MKNISFALTTEQIKNRSKTVTRRRGWFNLKRGDLLCACVKCQGLKHGEKVQRLCVIEVESVSIETLREVDKEDCRREGFPELTPREFRDMFCRNMKCDTSDRVTRIQFRYRDDLCVHGFTVGKGCNKGCRAGIAGD